MDLATFRVTKTMSFYYDTDMTKPINGIPNLSSNDVISAEPVGNGWYKIIRVVSSTKGSIFWNLALKPAEVSKSSAYIYCIENGSSANVKRIDASTDVISSGVPATDNKQQTNAAKRDYRSIQDVMSEINISLTKAIVSTNVTNISGLEEAKLKISNLRGVLGIPHQFLPTADPRLGKERLEITALGRSYYKHILKTMPLLFITPGVPKFTVEATAANRSLLETLMGAGNNEDTTFSGKYYSLKFDWEGYFQYVTPMLRLAATWLGIGKIELDGVALDSYNWRINYNGVSETGQSGIGTSLIKWLFGNAIYNHTVGRDCVVLYANCGENTSDSFSNSITQSGLASTINNASDAAREAQFITGTLGSQGVGYDPNEKSTLTSGRSTTGMTFLDSIVNKAKAIVSGGRLVFPQIWSDSSFSRSYTCNMKLVSPAGDKLSIFLNILVPIFHILGFSIARQTEQGGQTYQSPFLVRAYYKGMFNVDMGIIESLSVTKGTEGEWTVDGLPTVADVSFEIKDMYDGMFISSGGYSDTGNGEFLSNITELDYIANCCGININQMEGSRFQYYMTQIKNSGADIVNEITGLVAQWGSNFMERIFSTF